MQASSNKIKALFSQTSLIIFIFCILSIISAKPVYRSVERLVYNAMCNYYNAPPRWSIVKLFDNYADKFDNHLIHTLEYRVPKDLTELIHLKSALPNAIPKVLDLGCGTGLLGEELTKLFKIEHLDGVDFSANMLQKSKDKYIYNKLHQIDILEYLQNSSTKYDLITAADVLIYVGDLKELFENVYRNLNDSAYFAFSVESLEQGDFRFMASGRFQHNLDYIKMIASKTGFKNMNFKQVSVRKEHELVVSGHVVLLEKSASSQLHCKL